MRGKPGLTAYDRRGPEWLVIGTRGRDRIVLAERYTRDLAEKVAADMAKHLDHYDKIELERIGE